MTGDARRYANWRAAHTGLLAVTPKVLLNLISCPFDMGLCSAGRLRHGRALPHTVAILSANAYRGSLHQD